MDAQSQLIGKEKISFLAAVEMKPRLGCTPVSRSVEAKNINISIYYSLYKVGKAAVPQQAWAGPWGIR